MKTKIFYAIALLLLSLNGIAQSGSGTAGTVPPAYCNIFPICFENTTRCEIRICHDIKFVTSEEIQNGTPNMNGAYKICKTIGPLESVCITYEEFTALYPNHNIPSSYNVNEQTILEGVFQQTTVWASNIEDFPDVVTSPISVWQRDVSYGSVSTNCNGRRIALNFIKGCPGRYTITSF